MFSFKVMETSFLQYITQTFLSLPHLNLLIIIAILARLFLLLRRKCDIYLLDFACYRPSNSNRLPMSTYLENLLLSDSFTPDSLRFQTRILERSGFGHETFIPPSCFEIPVNKSLSLAIEEAQTIIFSLVGEVLQRNAVSPKAVDALIVNSSMFSPTPSLASMVVNKFRMRNNVMSYNLSGMGCSAGIISLALARDLLRVHRSSLALVVSTEMMAVNWYTGKNRSMLMTNCIFRMGGAAMLLSSKNKDKAASGYILQHLVRTNMAGDDPSYHCVFQDTDAESKIGVTLSKDILHVAGKALKANISAVGPLVLPISEQIRYGWSSIRPPIWLLRRGGQIYVPNFKRAFEHFCIHAGGRAVVQSIEEKLGLSEEDVEASKMTLYRFGNTSSSSIWYELCYIEAKGRMKRGDRVWQIQFGSGFKCNSAVWKCISDARCGSHHNAWSDRIHLYPVEVPDVIEIDYND